MTDPMNPTENKPELPAEMREAVERLTWFLHEAEANEARLLDQQKFAKDLRTVLAALADANRALERLHPYGREEIAELQSKLADAQRDRERLIELLSAASKYVPAGALYGDIWNKPVSETNLLGQIQAAMQEARR